MAETFKEICKILNKSTKCSKRDIADPDYGQKELLYLAVLSGLEELLRHGTSNKAQKPASPWSQDDTYVDSRHRYLRSIFDSSGFERRLDELGLATPDQATQTKLEYHTPRLFDGCL
ncbi:uncharacterized protein VICG_02216, partial [Vittaforma corneae ATCC 50505]